MDYFGKRVGFLKFKADIIDKELGKKVYISGQLDLIFSNQFFWLVCMCLIKIYIQSLLSWIVECSLTIYHHDILTFPKGMSRFQGLCFLEDQL